MAEEEKPSLNQKALAINLDPAIYGTIAEIGAGQEVARNFFRAGGASGTIAKTMCAYDMTFSDEIYGKSPRYVSRERLHTMLDHEYGLLLERLGKKRGAETCFFAYANTVAATSFGSDRDGNGWMGVRYQTEPGGAANEIVLHCQLLERNNQLQQIALGALGTNLVYAAFRHRESPERLISTLMDHLTPDQAEIDMIEFSGPAFEGVDNRLMALELVKQGLTNAILFSPQGTVLQPSAALYKRAILVERGSFRPVTNVSIDMIEAAQRTFSSDERVKEVPQITLMEITINNLLGEGQVDHSDFLARVDIIGALGYHVLISNYPEYYRLGAYFRRYTAEQIGIAMGINNLLEIFNEKYYGHLAGGILEAFGRLFKNTVKLYVYPMHRDGLQHYRRFSMLGAMLEATEEGGNEIPEVVTANCLYVDDHLKHLYQYLLKNGYIVGLEGYHPNFMKVFSRDVLKQIAEGNEAWREHVPAVAAQLIEERGLFGCAKVSGAACR